MNKITQAIVESFGASLLHSLWQGLVIVLMLTIVLELLKRRSSQLKYLLSCCSLLALLLWMGNTFIFHFVQSFQNQEVIPTALVVGGMKDLGFVKIMNFTDLDKSLGYYIRSFTDVYSKEIVLVWLLGASLFLIKWSGSFYYTYSLKRSGNHLLPLKWQNRVNELSKSLGIKKNIRILESVKIEVPMVVGYLKPVILIPSSILMGFTPVQLEAIIVHELAHIKNNDFLINLILSALEIVLFYHPVYWYVYSIISKERENNCDDSVVAYLGDSRLYVETLFHMEKIRQQHSLAVALQGKKNHLLDRIKRICRSSNKYKGEMNRSIIVWSLLFIVAVFFVEVPLNTKENILSPLKKEFDEWFVDSGDLKKNKLQKGELALKKKNIVNVNKTDTITPNRVDEEIELNIENANLQEDKAELDTTKLRFDKQANKPRGMGVNMKNKNGEISNNNEVVELVSEMNEEGGVNYTLYENGKVNKQIFLEKGGTCMLNGVRQELKNGRYTINNLKDVLTLEGVIEIVSGETKMESGGQFKYVLDTDYYFFDLNNFQLSNNYTKEEVNRLKKKIFKNLYI